MNKYYVGTARGVLLCCTSNNPNDLKSFRNDESTEVSALIGGRNPDEVILGYGSGHAYIFDTAKDSFIKKIVKLEGDGGVTGICCIGKSILIARKDGIINLWTNKKNNYFSLELDEAGTLDAVAYNINREHIIGTGGEVNDYKLWDVETKQPIFKAKSLGHDHLQLPIPTSVRGISFFNREPNLGACCTKQGHVLLYDDRAQRKPIVKFLEEKASYSTISSAFRECQVFVGTTKGYMQMLDLRKPPKVLKTYTTFTGCVTDIACDPLEPFVTTVSLDRHLRVHVIDSKEVVTKVYMKQSLTQILVKPVIKDEDQPKEEPKDKEAIDQEYDELFNNMEKIEDDKSTKKGKRKIQDKNTQKLKRKKTGNVKK